MGLPGGEGLPSGAGITYYMGCDLSSSIYCLWVLPDSLYRGGRECPVVILGALGLRVDVPQPHLLRLLVPVDLDIAGHQHFGGLLNQDLSTIDTGSGLVGLLV